jgi:hypothetical protein
MKVPRENVRRNRGSTRRDFCEFVGSLIVPPSDVVELEAMEHFFKVSHLLAVGLHIRIVAA